MKYEQERAKAKRAKERARLRKQQAKPPMPDPESDHDQEVNEQQQQNRDTGDDESYSNPVDLIPSDEIHQYQNHPLAVDRRRQQEQQLHHQQSQQHHRNPPPAASLHQHQLSNQSFDENYSNPVDLISSTGDSRQSRPKAMVNSQRAVGASFGRHEEDEIYYLPVANESRDGVHGASVARPNHLDIRGRYGTLKNIPPKYVTYTNIPFRPFEPENIAAAIDPTYDHQQQHQLHYSGGKKASTTPLSVPSTAGTPSSLPDFLDHSSTSPVPPYMPIQGTRRNMNDGKKKKSAKEKCTHQ